jgi:diacylglycerol diphosphate phosphatase/phosphatidate phosphatase
MEPFHRMFTLDNINLHYPHALVERVSVSKTVLIMLEIHWLTGIAWNIIYAGVIPFLVLSLWLAAARSSAHKVQVTLLGFFIA